MSNGPIGAQHLSSASRDDDRDLTSLKARTLYPMPISNLLNAVEGENHFNESSTFGSTGHSVPSRSHVHRQVNQEASYSQVKNWEHQRTVNPEPPQPSSQRDSPSIHYSSYSQASPIVYAGQPRYFPSNPSSVPSSTMVQVPPSSTAVQNQRMVLIQAPIDVQAASKVADEKRRRNATASHRFRQRRKEKNSENVANLEAQGREMEKERDHYRTERDYFRDLARSHYLPVAPRPLSPKRVCCNEWSIACTKLRS
jgi:hypothetical protein